MLHQEIQWQLKHGIECEEDIKVLSGRGTPPTTLWPEMNSSRELIA